MRSRPRACPTSPGSRHEKFVHVPARRAKDFGSAAVMLSVITVLVVWLLVLVG